MSIFNYAIVGNARPGQARSARDVAGAEEVLLDHGTVAARGEQPLRNQLLIEVVPVKLEAFGRERSDVTIRPEDVEVLVRPFC